MTTSTTSAPLPTNNPWVKGASALNSGVRYGGRPDLYALYDHDLPQSQMVKLIASGAKGYFAHNRARWRINPFLRKGHFDAIEFLKGKGSAVALLNKYLSGDLSSIKDINTVLVNRVRATNPAKAKRMLSRMPDDIRILLIQEGVLSAAYAQELGEKHRDSMFSADLGL